MKIVEPLVELWKQGDDVKAHVAKCARVCYGKESGNDDDLIRLSNLYDIYWKANNTFKDKNIKDITVKDYNNYIKSISIVSNL